MAPPKKIKLPIQDSAEKAVRSAMRLDLDGTKKRSSVPHGDFKELTEGRQPRTRLADSREMSFRDKEDFINHYKDNLTRSSQGRIDVPEGMVPEGHTFLWARATVRDRPDPTNLRNLEGKGWTFVTCDEMPGLAFYDHLHGVRDDDEHIYNGGLVAMKRYKELTDMELKHFAKLSNEQTQALNSRMRTLDGDLHPFSINSRNQFADPFLNNTPVGQDFRMQLQD